MAFTANYVEDTRPLTSVVLHQPKGSLDLTLAKNKDGNRIRISNKKGMVVNVATSEVAEFISVITKIAKQGVKSASRRAA